MYTLILYTEEQHREEMTFTRLTQKARDIENTLRLQKAHLHAWTARSEPAATAKVPETILSTRASPSSLQVHCVERSAENTEGLSLVDEESVTNPEYYIDTGYIPSTMTTNSEDDKEHFMIVGDRNSQQLCIV